MIEVSGWQSGQDVLVRGRLATTCCRSGATVTLEGRQQRDIEHPQNKVRFKVDRQVRG